MLRSLNSRLSDKRGEKGTAGPSLQEAMQRGVAASEAGDKQAAHAIFQQVVEQFPKAVEPWVWLGWTSPDIEGAEAAFMQARAVDPMNEEVAMGLRWVASQRAEAPAQPAVQPSAQSPALAAEAADSPADMEASTVVITPTGAGDFYDAGGTVAAEEISAFADAFPIAEEAPQLAPRRYVGPDIEALMQSGIAAVEQGDKTGAYNIFEHLASIQSSNPKVWVWLGGTSPSLNDAEKAFRRARELDPDSEQAALGLRWVTLRQQAALVGSAPSATTQSGFMPYVDEGKQRKEGPLSKFFKLFSKS